jgi:hypothetical protein
MRTVTPTFTICNQATDLLLEAQLLQLAIAGLADLLQGQSEPFEAIHRGASRLVRMAKELEHQLSLKLDAERGAAASDNFPGLRVIS